jgi:hypothetical protein
VVEGALEGELDEHLGYAKYDRAGRNGGNSRNGHRAKTVLTEAGLGPRWRSRVARRQSHALVHLTRLARSVMPGPRQPLCTDGRSR